MSPNELTAEQVITRLQRVLTTDPGMGIIRHSDAGYDEAIEAAKRFGIRVPMMEE